MSPQPARPTHRRQRLHGIVGDKYTKAAGYCLQYALLLRADLPQRKEGDTHGGEDLASECIEGDDDGSPWVADGEEGNEGTVPLDAGQDGLVAGFEVVEISEDGEHNGAYGFVSEAIEVDDFSER